MRQIDPIFIIGCLLIPSILSGCSHRKASSSGGASDPCRNVPFITAASHHDGYPQVQALLAQGANVNTVNGCGQTALSVAAELNNVDIVALLLNRGANVNTDFPLVGAASGGNLASAQLLLEHGADIEARGCGLTPLIAAVDNHIRVGALLSGHSDKPIDVDTSGHADELIDVEKLLIDHGANVNATRGGKTALMVARRRHFIQTVALLQKAGAIR